MGCRANVELWLQVDDVCVCESYVHTHPGRKKTAAKREWDSRSELQRLLRCTQPSKIDFSFVDDGQKHQSGLGNAEVVKILDGIGHGEWCEDE